MKQIKDVQVLVRATEAEREEWRRLALADGVGLSEWIRSRPSVIADLLKDVLVPLDAEDRGKFERAAKAVGKSVSAWLRDLGAAAVAPPQPLRAYSFPKPNSPSPFAPLVEWDRAEEDSPEELARMRRSGPPVVAGTAAMASSFPSAGPDSPWLKRLREFEAMAEVDPEESCRMQSRELDGFKRPKGWTSMAIGQKASVLDVERPLI